MYIRFNFWKSLFSSLARHRACPDLTAAPTAGGCRSERSPAGLPPSVPDFETPRSRRTDLCEEGGGGVRNTRTRILTCSRAERRKPGAERTTGAASPAGSECGLRAFCPAPGQQPCCSGRRSPLLAPGVCGQQDHATEGVPDLHAAHRGRGKRRARPRPRLAFRPLRRGAASPSVPLRRLLAGASTAGGRQTWWNVVISKTRGLEGQEEGELLFLFVTQPGRAALGGARDFKWALCGAPRIQITGDQNAPKGVGVSPPSN